MTGNLFASQTWFTADLRLGDKSALLNRPFETVDEMNTTIIEKWNERVDPGDTVWVLGNFGSGHVYDSIALASLLHGRKILVAGAHDQCFHGYEADRDRGALERWVAVYREAGFSSVVTGKAMLKRTGRPVTIALRHSFGEPPVLSVRLSHFPLEGDSDPAQPDRYARYRPRSSTKPGSDPWLLHGHVGNAWTVNDRQVNVGVAVWDFAPVSSDTLLSVITDGMPICNCSGESHQMGSPGCVLNEA